jgi:preprotein translocase subunit SecA
MSQKLPDRPIDNVPIEERIARLRVGTHKEALSPEKTAQLRNAWHTLEKMGHTCAHASDQELKRSAAEIMTKLRTNPMQEGLQIAWLALTREWIFRKTADRTRPIYAHAEQMLAAIWHLEAEKGVMAEIKTGEGKTLTFALISSVMAAMGHKVDIMTTSHNLSVEGANFFNEMLSDLGLRATVPPGDEEQNLAKRRAGYAGDVVYSPVDRGVFDSLFEQYYGQPSRGFRPYDTLLLDEADYALMDSLSSYRISTSSGRESEKIWLYYSLNQFIDQFPDSAIADESWSNKARAWLLRYNPEHQDTINQWDDLQLMEWLASAHRAKHLQPDRDYVKRENPTFSKPGLPAYQAVVVDADKSGELKESSRWSQGVHQFLHARLGFPVEEEGTAAPSMTLPQFVRQYKHFHGMTGTAGNHVELAEMKERFGLEAVFLPPHNLSQRIDLPTIITTGSSTEETPDTQLLEKLQLGRAEKAHFDTIAAEVERIQASGRACLIAFETIDDVNRFAAYLEQKGINSYARLDGLSPEEESAVIAGAGKPGAITLTTILGGRGIDPKPLREVLAVGGLHVIPALLPASGRVELQLRGRAGRQGAPGSSRMIVNGEALGLHSPPPQELYDTLIEAHQNHRIESNSLMRFKQDFEADVMQRYQQEFVSFVQAFQSSVYEKLKLQLGLIDKGSGSVNSLLKNALLEIPAFMASLAVNRERAIIDVIEKVVLPVGQTALGAVQQVRGNVETKKQAVETGYRIFYAFANAATMEWDTFDDKARRLMDRYFEQVRNKHGEGNYRDVLNLLKENIGQEVEPLWLTHRELMLARMNEIAQKVGLQPLPLSEVLSVKLEKPLSLDELKQHNNPIMRVVERTLGEDADRALQSLGDKLNGLFQGNPKPSPR